VRPWFRYFNVAIAIGAVAGLTWVFTLPDKTKCLASGRRVDPTERHCGFPGDFVQLREHALFHTRDVALGVTVIWVLAYFAHRRLNRISQ
jgi:hypothetical protein